MADRGGASIGMETRKEKKKKKKGQKADDDSGAKGFKGMFPSNSPIPGGEGVSEDEQRKDVRYVVTY